MGLAGQTYGGQQQRQQEGGGDALGAYRLRPPIHPNWSPTTLPTTRELTPPYYHRPVSLPTDLFYEDYVTLQFPEPDPS